MPNYNADIVQPINNGAGGPLDVCTLTLVSSSGTLRGRRKRPYNFRIRETQKSQKVQK
jgi:hypothetical protein